MASLKGKPERRLTVAEQIADSALRKCKHFTGMMNDRCPKGHVYLEMLDQERQYPEERLACFRGGPDLCPDREFPTEEEAAARGREAEEHSRKNLIALIAVQADAAGRRGIAGQIPCPCCEGGTIRYSVARVNAHIWAACSTKGCVGWMQ